MAGRGPQTFKKRQKEQQRKEKQEEKRQKRIQRKIDGPQPEGEDEENPLDLDDDLLSPGSSADPLSSVLTTE
jgi:hypothetical protein